MLALFALSCLALILGFLIPCGGDLLETRQGADRVVRDAEPARGFSATVSSLLQAVRVHAVGSCTAGVAGALYVPQVGTIKPIRLALANSIEAVIWVAVGGRGTLIGAAPASSSSTTPRPYFRTSGPAGAVLAVHARGAVHPGDAAVAEGHQGDFRFVVETVEGEALIGQRLKQVLAWKMKATEPNPAGVKRMNKTAIPADRACPALSRRRARLVRRLPRHQ